jgi:NADP-dependent aldehyde dehydrogenase
MRNDEMTISGEMLIGARAVRGTAGEVRSVNAASHVPLDPPFGGATPDDLDQACQLAADAFQDYRARPLEERALFLEAIADAILDIGDELIERCMAETGLPAGRLEGERGRTVGQLRLFAGIVRAGDFLGLRVDPALPERKPLPRPDLRLRNVPLGPVAIFGASNFPLAFSVAGGDTASALAAGCSVVAKAHPAHLGTSELVGRAVQAAARQCGMPQGVFSLIYDSGFEISQALVLDPRIKAGGFTGSRRGGLALLAIAQGRPEPIPFYAEMSSINPVILLPGALEEKADQIAKAFVGSLTLGAGQFCTNPGLVIAVESAALDRFTSAAAAELGMMPAATMLTPGILNAYRAGVDAIGGHGSVLTLGLGRDGNACEGRAALFSTRAEDFIRNRDLQDEIFGAASLIVRCRDQAEMIRVIGALEGQLTVAIHMTDGDHDAARKLLPRLELRAGRILVNGFGTGVEVAHAMVHGGPFPSTSDGRSTSVGGLAIERFLRPVCYQDMPEALLPAELARDNPLSLPILIEGRR